MRDSYYVGLCSYTMFAMRFYGCETFEDHAKLVFDDIMERQEGQKSTDKSTSDRTAL